MQTVISVKVDKGVKTAAAEVARSAGLTLSSLVNAYLRQIVATPRIEIYAPESMTPKLEKLIVAVERELANGQLSEEYQDTESFLAALKR